MAYADGTWLYPIDLGCNINNETVREMSAFPYGLYITVVVTDETGCSGSISVEVPEPNEIRTLRGSLGLPVERDLFFAPCLSSKITIDLY